MPPTSYNPKGGSYVQVQFTPIRANTNLYKNALDRIGQDLKFETLEVADELIRVMEPYPPPSASGRARTFTLQGSWVSQHRAETNKFTIVVSNKATSRGRFYGAYVVGLSQQGYHRRTGWKRVHEEARKLQGPFTKRCRDIIRRNAQGLGR